MTLGRKVCVDELAIHVALVESAKRELRDK